MPRLSAEPKNNYTLVKAAAAAIAVGLHLMVLAAIFPSSETQPEITLADGADVQFVEISGDIVEDAPGEPLPANVEVAAEAVQQEPAPKDMQAEEPSSQPAPQGVLETPEEPLPEPPPPKPEPVVAPPEEVVPEALREPETKPEPAAKPEPTPKPKPAPKSKPVVKASEAPAKPAPMSRPQAATSVKQSAAPPGNAAKADTTANPQATAKDLDRPRLVSKVDYQGRRPNPVYPRASERRGEQGRVVVRVLISAQGNVSQVSVQSSSGYDRLDKAALKAARIARFKPYMENGIAYQALADIPFDFVL
jgi:protein TonB